MSTNFHDSFQDGVTGWNDDDMSSPLGQLDLAIGVLGQLSVIDRNLTAPPGSPSDRDTYIVASGGTGAWSGHDGEIAFYDNTNTEWVFATPREGWRAYINDEDIYIYYTGSAWSAESVDNHSHSESDINDKLFSIGMMFSGTPDAGKLWLYAVSVAFTLPSGLSNSQAVSDTAANSQAQFTIKKNTTTIGTITFSAGYSTGLFSFTATQSFSVGDVLKITGPDPQDSALADIAVSLRGTR